MCAERITAGGRSEQNVKWPAYRKKLGDHGLAVEMVFHGYGWKFGSPGVCKAEIQN